MSLFVSGLATVLQTRRIGPVGSGLLSIQGTSFTFIAPIITTAGAAMSHGASVSQALALVFGLSLAGAFVVILTSRFIRTRQQRDHTRGHWYRCHADRPHVDRSRHGERCGRLWREERRYVRQPAEPWARRARADRHPCVQREPASEPSHAVGRHRARRRLYRSAAARTARSQRDARDAAHHGPRGPSGSGSPSTGTTSCPSC